MVVSDQKKDKKKTRKGCIGDNLDVCISFPCRILPVGPLLNLSGRKEEQG